MARALPYRAKCPPNIAALIEEAPYSRLFVLSDPGPTSFVLRGEASPRRFKVTIGETHSCTCHSGKELCAHVLFVLTRVFRMPAANPLVWQLSLTEREIAELMRGRVTMHTRPPPRRAAAEGGGAGEDGVERREVGEDEVCPICYDTMDPAQEITYCKSGCGNNVHTKCMKMWADNRIANGEEVTCPMCRTGWGVPDWLDSVRTRRERFDGLAVHHGVGCRGCNMVNFAGTRYKCMICNNYDLCAECFTAGSAHRQHPFVCRENIDSEWVAAERPAPNAGTAGAADGSAADGGGDAASGLRATVPVDLLTKLPTAALTEDECSGVGGDSRCGVCGDAFRPGQVARTLPCGCRYHQRCIDRRLMEQMDRCPNGAAGRGGEACLAPITAASVQVQLELTRAQAVAKARRQQQQSNRQRRRPLAAAGARGNGGALEFALGGLAITTSASGPGEPEPAQPEASEVSPTAAAATPAELQRQRAALAAERRLLAQEDEAAAPAEPQPSGPSAGRPPAEGLGALLSAQTAALERGALSLGGSAILASESPVPAAVAAEASRRNQSAAQPRLRDVRQRRRRPATVGEQADPATLMVGAAAAGDGAGSDERSSTAPMAGRAHGATAGRRRSTGRPRQPMDAGREATKRREPTGDTAGGNWQGMFVGSDTAATSGDGEAARNAAPGRRARGQGRPRARAEPAAAEGQEAQSLLDLSVGSGDGRPPPPVGRRASGRLVRGGPVGRRGSAGAARRGVGQAATAAVLAEVQAAAAEAEQEVLAEASRRQAAAAAEGRAARLAREERRRRATQRAGEERAAAAAREEERAEARRASQARIAARAASHREEQVAADRSRLAAREAAAEAAGAQAAW